MAFAGRKTGKWMGVSPSRGGVSPREEPHESLSEAVIGRAGGASSDMIEGPMRSIGYPPIKNNPPGMPGPKKTLTGPMGRAPIKTVTPRFRSTPLKTIVDTPRRNPIKTIVAEGPRTPRKVVLPGAPKVPPRPPIKVTANNLGQGRNNPLGMAVADMGPINRGNPSTQSRSLGNRDANIGRSVNPSPKIVGPPNPTMIWNRPQYQTGIEDGGMGPTAKRMAGGRARPPRGSRRLSQFFGE